MIDQKFVSVIIPCRNEQLYIENCVNSILNHDCSSDKITIIVVDGLSDDNKDQIYFKEIALDYLKEKDLEAMINTNY